MSTRRQRKPFAEVVREVRESPSRPVPARNGVVGPDGRRWHLVAAELAPAEALARAAAGAAVAWDPCGCRGYCAFTWYTHREGERMVAAGEPVVRLSKRHNGGISEWATLDGQRLVVAEDAVTWGGLLGC